MTVFSAVRSLRRGLALAVLLFAAGCTTTNEVRDIVRAGNYEMLLAADPALATTVPADADKGPRPAPAAAARLTAFLQANADDPVLGPALHLRQALLYLNEREFALADAAFAQARGAKFTAPRDTALALAYPDLKWWTTWSLAAGGAFRSQRDEALARLKAFATHSASPALKDAPDVRDYFLEMRAWIGLKLAFAVALPAEAEFQNGTLADAINTWTDNFAAADLALLNNPRIGADQAFALSTRRALRLRVLLDTLAGVVRSGGDLVAAPSIRFRAPEARTYYEAKLPLAPR